MNPKIKRSLTRWINLLSLSLLIVAGMASHLPAAEAHPAQQTGCYFTAGPGGNLYFHSPVNLKTTLAGLLPEGTTYPVTLRTAGDFFYYIQIDTTRGGWIQRLNGGTMTGDCGPVPQDTRLLTDFDTLCVVSTTTPIPTYTDPGLSRADGSRLSAGSYVAISQAPGAYIVMFDEARSSGWFSASSVTTRGPCAGLAEPGKAYGLTLEGTVIRQEPAASADGLPFAVPAGSLVEILEGPQPGDDPAVMWYRVYLAPYAPGWVPAHAIFDSAALPPVFAATQAAPSGSDVTALVTDNTRAWTLPDVYQGKIIVELSAGMQVSVMSGPVTGAIRLDSNATGNWYLVAWGPAASGWVWEGRLVFD
ncbi:MAG: hypothetical protein HY866_13100 [Chloroflexi bacterium]|nr:hypothetical protein [Chloroflexota bacterium]